MAVRTIACLPAVDRRLARTRAAACCCPPRAPSPRTTRPSSGPTSIPPGTRTLNMSQLGRVLTDATLAPPVKALFVYNSNPAAVAPEQESVRAGLRARGPVHGRPRAVPDRHRGLRRHRAARDHHPRALRHPQGLRPPVPEPEPAGDRAARRVAAEHRDLPAAWPRAWASTIPRCARATRTWRARPCTGSHPNLPGSRSSGCEREGSRAPQRAGSRTRPSREGGFPTPSGKCELLAESLEAPGPRPPGRLRAAARERHDRAGAGAPLPAGLHLAAGPPLPELHLLGAAGLRAARGRAEPHHPPAATRRRAASRTASMVRVFNDRGSFLAKARVSDAARARASWWASRSGGRRCARAAATPTRSPARS